MINLEQIRDVFRQRIFDSGIFTAIQWENQVLDDSAKGGLWMAESYLPLDENFSDSTNGNQLEGIFQYYINSKLGTSEEDITSATIQLGNLFNTAEVIETSDYKISVGTPKRSSQGKLDDAWYTIIVEIDFKAYE